MSSEVIPLSLVCVMCFRSCFLFLRFMQDVDWHATNENVFASVGDDKMLMMYVSVCNLKAH